MKAYCEGAGEEAKGDLRDEEPQGCDRLLPQSLDDSGWLHSKSSQIQFRYIVSALFENGVGI
jgi:hypothetical protein